MRKNKLFTAAMRTLALAGIVTIVSACGGGQEQQQQAGNQAQVATYTVQAGNIDLNDAYPATIKGKTDIEVRPLISGTITKVCVEEGQRVSKGQLLFLIDDVTLQANVESAKASVVSAKAAIASAQSQVATAQLTADNQKKLYDKGIISSYAYETATLNLRAAQEQLNQARSGLSQAQAAVTSAQKNLSYARVVAPSSGVVGAINQREGALASPSGIALTTVSDNSSVYAYFSLNEKQIIELSANGSRSLQSAISQMPQVRLRLADGSTYSYAGRVSTVAGVLDQSTGSAQVRALFPNPNGLLRSGSTGDVLVPATGRGAGLLVPQSATYEVQDMVMVFKVVDGKAVGTPIKVLPQNDGKFYVVTSGLKAGDVIAAEGVGVQVREGTEIVAKSAAAPAQKQ